MADVVRAFDKRRDGVGIICKATGFGQNIDAGYSLRLAPALEIRRTDIADFIVIGILQRPGRNSSRRFPIISSNKLLVLTDAAVARIPLPWD